MLNKRDQINRFKAGKLVMYLEKSLIKMRTEKHNKLWFFMFGIFLSIALLIFYLDSKFSIMHASMVLFIIMSTTVVVSLWLTKFIYYLPVLFFWSFLLPLQKNIGPITFFTYDLIIIPCLLMWILSVLLGKHNSLGKGTYILLAILTIWLFISGYMGKFFLASLDEILIFLRLFFIFCFFSIFVQHDYTREIVIKNIIFFVAVEGFLGILQYITKSNIGSPSDYFGESSSVTRLVGDGLFRVKGTFSYDTSLGTFFELWLPLVFALSLVARNKKIFYIALVAGFFGLLFTFTRGAWISTLFGVAIVFFYAFKKGLVRNSQVKKVVFFAIFVSPVLIISSWDIINERFSSEDSSSSLETRSSLNVIAIKTIFENPVTGLGLGGFGQEAINQGMFATSEKEARVHNIFLFMATETGLVGLVIFLMILVGWVYMAFQNVKTVRTRYELALSIGLLAGLMGVLLHGMMAWSIFSPVIAPHFWMLVGFVYAVYLRKFKN